MNWTRRINLATKDANASIVLLQLRYWIGKNMPKGRDSTSIGMTDLAEMVGLSFDQTKRAVDKLRRLGFIRTSQHLFAGKNINSYHLTLMGKELCFGTNDALPGGSNSALPGQDETALPEQCESALLYIQEPSTLINNNEVLQSDQPDGDPKPSPDPAETVMGEIDMTHSVKDVPGMVSAKKMTFKPSSLTYLDHAWRTGMKEYVSQTLPPLSQKDMAFLKAFNRQCEVGTAKAILQFVMAEWIGFTKFCEQEGGAYKTPATPAPWFLGKHAQLAVTFYLQKKSKQSMAPASINPKPLPVQLIAGPKPAQPSVTLDELLAPVDQADALKD